jgi:hypothetical protein
MLATEQALISFFERVAQKDSAHLDKLKQERRFLIEQGRWYFTLPDLFSFLQQEDDIFSGIDYKQFRRAIFDSPINQIVRSCGAEIIIADNRAKVDQSSYALIWHPKG